MDSFSQDILNIYSISMEMLVLLAVTFSVLIPPLYSLFLQRIGSLNGLLLSSPQHILFDNARWMNGQHLRSLPSGKLNKLIGERWKSSGIVMESGGSFIEVWLSLSSYITFLVNYRILNSHFCFWS